ncbi:hypothetical protein M1E11_13295 [Bacillus sp. JZ8]
MNWDEFMFGKCNKKDRDYQEDKYYFERKREDKKDRCCKEDKHENKYYVERKHDMNWDEFMFGKCNEKDRDYQEDKYYFERKREDKKDRCCKENKHDDKYYVKRKHHEDKKDRYY